MRATYRMLLLLSFVFLAVSLYEADYLRIPEFLSPAALIESVVLLFASFLAEVFSWKVMLSLSGFEASATECTAGIGLSIFGKFVPGKVWSIAGRAAYLAQKGNYRLTELIVVSLQTQLAALWIGLMFGCVGLCTVGSFIQWGLPVTSLWLLLTALVFSPAIRSVASGAGRFILRRKIDLPRGTAKAVGKSCHWFVLNNLLMAAAFYLLAKGLLGIDVPWSVGLGFPLAGALGIMAIFAPGGIGVREGVLTGYLVLAGIPLADATTVAVASRLWFLLGELIMFGVGLAAARFDRRIALSATLADLRRESPP